MSKILCPFHEESTPSCEVYPSGYVCFGCGAKGTLKDIEEAIGKTASRNLVANRAFYKKRPEDIATRLRQIATLPKKIIRGLELPYDESGYYIVYPNVPYYTKRLWSPPRPADKYRGPMGHRKPLLVAQHTNYRVLFVVEGQLNALTLALVTARGNIVSPGSATDLNRPDFVKYYLQFEHICVIVDRDAAGAIAGTVLRDTLLANRKDVALLAIPKDFNDLLNEEDGKEKVQQAAIEAVGLHRRL